MCFAFVGVVHWGRDRACHSFFTQSGIRAIESVSVEARGGGQSMLALRAVATETIPELWKVGPADVFTGHAQTALYLMKYKPELFDSCIEEELEALREQREQDKRQKGALDETAKQDTLVLRQRVDEVRAKERERIISELIYLSVCNKFQELQVPLIGPMKDGGDVKYKAIDLKGLTTDVYTKDALEMVREHLFSIIGQHGKSTSALNSLSIVQIALFQAGQVYAMSALFGYYLRRIDARYQLERLAGTFGAFGDATPAESAAPPFEDNQAESLKDYISSFGPKEMARLTAMASMEAQTAMEAQVSAVFGDLRVLKAKLLDTIGRVSSPEDATRTLEEAIANKNVESIRISTDDLRRLVLEAVAFGSLLNDSEKQFDSIYELTPRREKFLGTLTGDDEEGRMLPL